MSTKSFRIREIAIVATLALSALVLAGVSASQGPRLKDANINTSVVISRTGGQLVLTANQPLAELDQNGIQITPATDFSATVDGPRIIIRFTALLHYAENYTVHISASSLATAAVAEIDYQFQTADIDIFSLERRANEDDRILRHQLSEAVSNIPVFSSRRIQEYAVLGKTLAVVTLDEENAAELRLIEPEENNTARVNLPEEIRGIRELRPLDAEGIYGFILDTAGALPTSTLYLHDLNDGTGVPREVRGPGGIALAAMSWAPVPGTTSLVVQAFDQQIYLVDQSEPEKPPAPIGQHVELRDFLPGTTTLIVADPETASTIDLGTGEVAPLSLPLADTPQGSYPGAFTLLSPTVYTEVYADPLGLSTGPLSALYRIDAEGTRELYSPARDGDRIGQVCRSPNGQYLAVEVIPKGSLPDHYPHKNGWENTSIYFVDSLTGLSTRGVTGMASNWC